MYCAGGEDIRHRPLQKLIPNRKAEVLLGFGTLMPHLRGMVRGRGGASASEGDDPPYLHQLHILPFGSVLFHSEGRRRGYGT